MKAVVLGDVHFGTGYSLGKVDKLKRLNSRLLDFSATFDYVIDYLISNEIKVLIITGDIFEFRRPKASELGIFAEKIQRLEEHGIQTHIVAGNHDIIADERTTTIDVLQKLKLPNTFIYSEIDSFECGKEDRMNFVFLPYRTKSILGCTTNKDSIERVKERIDYEVDKFSKGNKFLVGHFMFKQTMLGSMTLEKNADEVVFPTEMFESFDGTIVGHIHPHQILNAQPLMCYVGSMECKDFGEADLKKYFLVIDNDGGELVFNFEALPTRKLHDIKFDLSSSHTSDEFLAELKTQLLEFSKENSLKESIVRLTVYVSNSVINDFNIEEIKQYMKNTFDVFHCVGVHPFIMSKKQLRKSSITESKDPKDSFVEYVNDIFGINEKEEMREKLIEWGLDIIKKDVK